MSDAYSKCSLQGRDSSMQDYNFLEGTMLESLQPYRNLPPIAPHSRYSRRVLSCVYVTALLLLLVCDGTSGVLIIVAEAGPLTSLLSYIGFAVFVALPYSYIVTELCSAFPDDGGFTVWVLNAFGPFWAVQVGYWSWLCDSLKTALLARLLLNKSVAIFGLSIPSETVSYFACVVIALTCAVFIIGRLCQIARCALILATTYLLITVTYTIWAFSKTRDFSRLGDAQMHMNNTLLSDNKVTPEIINLGWDSLTRILFENYNGFHLISVIGSGVLNPGKTFPRSIWIALCLSVIVYVVPASSFIVSSNTHWSQYTRVRSGTVAREIGDKALEWLIFCSTVCSYAGQMMTRVLSQSYCVSGMAEHQIAPPIFAKKLNLSQSPIVALLFAITATIALLLLEIEFTLPVLNVLTCAAQLSIIGTVIRLRQSCPYVVRPYKVPGNLAVLVIITIPHLIISSFLLFESMKDIRKAAITSSFFAPGFFYGYYQYHQQKKKVAASDSSSTLTF